MRPFYYTQTKTNKMKGLKNRSATMAKMFEFLNNEQNISLLSDEELQNKIVRDIDLVAETLSHALEDAAGHSKSPHTVITNALFSFFNKGMDCACRLHGIRNVEMFNNSEKVMDYQTTLADEINKVAKAAIIETAEMMLELLMNDNDNEQPQMEGGKDV